jgi:hypothetical protein
MTWQLDMSSEASLSALAKDRLDGSDVMLRPSKGNMLPILVDELDRVAKRVRMRLKNMSAHIIEIGGELSAVKQRLEHGQFLRWVIEECELAPRHAQLMMRATQWAEGRDEIVSHLEPTTLYLLAAPSTPKTARQEVLALLEEGQRPAPQVVKDLIRAAKQRMPDEPASSGKRGLVVPPSQAARFEDLLPSFLTSTDMRSGDPMLQAADPSGAEPEPAEDEDAWLDGALKLISLLAEAVSLNAHSISRGIMHRAVEFIPLLVEAVLEQQEIPRQEEIDRLLGRCGYTTIADRLVRRSAQEITKAAAELESGEAADVA